MNKEEIEKLARYNSEVNRGIMHTVEYDIDMKKLQEKYDDKEITSHNIDCTGMPKLCAMYAEDQRCEVIVEQVFCGKEPCKIIHTAS